MGTMQGFLAFTHNGITAELTGRRPATFDLRFRLQPLLPLSVLLCGVFWGAERGWPRQFPGESVDTCFSLVGKLSPVTESQEVRRCVLALVWLRPPEVFPKMPNDVAKLLAEKRLGHLRCDPMWTDLNVDWRRNAPPAGAACGWLTCCFWSHGMQVRGLGSKVSPGPD